MAQSEKVEAKQDEDIIQSTIGNFGKWQLKLSVLMALLKFPIAWFQLSIIFLAPPTEFWCKSGNGLNFTTNENMTMKTEGLNSGYCKMILTNDSKMTSCLNGYEYNRTTFPRSIITEWDLVCDRKRLVDITQLTLMFGILLGSIIFGVLADRKGRKITLLICIFLQSAFGILSAFIPFFWGFVTSRFLLAIANGGTTVVSFVMCMEVVGGHWKAIVPILYQIPFGFGNSIMAAIAYFFRDWRDLQLIISLLSSIYIVYIWLIPESPRWLIAVGRKEEAMKILEEAAVYNNLDVAKVQEVATALSNLPQQTEKKASVGLLFTTRELRKRTLLLIVNWLIVGVTFYAFSQYTGKVGKNMYLTAAISGFVALPGTVLCIYIVRRYGRRYTIAAAHLLTAFCFFGILFVPLGVYRQDWPRVAFAGVGIIGLSVSMPALYLYTGELFPTTLRNVGVGVSVMFSRLGSMIAPLVIALQDLSPSLTLIILGVGALIETVLILPLPETKGVPFLETIHDLQTQAEKAKHPAELETFITPTNPKEES